MYCQLSERRIDHSDDLQPAAKGLDSRSARRRLKRKTGYSEELPRTPDRLAAGVIEPQRPIRELVHADDLNYHVMKRQKD